MNEQISKIKNELEPTGKYDLTLSRLLNKAINLDLINLCVDEGEPHYFLTARGITYINLLNKEDLK